MRLAIILMLVLLVPFTSAYVGSDIEIRSSAHTFASGLSFDKIRSRSIILAENPADVRSRVRGFNGNLDLIYWEDPDFHPAIFMDFSNYQLCGRYPERFCLALNEFGGFVVNHKSAPFELVGYGVYDRLKVNRGKLYPTGQSRIDIIYQNMELLNLPFASVYPTKTGEGIGLYPFIVTYPWNRGYQGNFLN